MARHDGDDEAPERMPAHHPHPFRMTEVLAVSPLLIWWPIMAGVWIAARL